MDTHKLRHLARTTPPDIIRGALEEFDKLVMNTALGIIGEGEQSVPGPTHAVSDTLEQLTRQRVFRPATKGGLAMRSTADTTQAAYTAGHLQALPIVAQVISGTLDTDTFHEALQPLGDPDAVIDAETVRAMCTAASCLRPALDPTQWGEWKLALERVTPGALHRELGEAGVTDGAIPEGGHGSVRPAPPEHVDVVYQTPPQLLRAALSGRLPKRLQHVLSTILEADRDKKVDDDLCVLAGAERLAAAEGVWRSHTPLSLRFILMQLQACSGPGQAWVLDTGKRSDRFGRPREGTLHMHEDGPLEAHLYRMTMRARLLLPIGRLLRLAQVSGGYDEDTLPSCHCGQPCGKPKRGGGTHTRLLDVFGCHCATRTVASCYTPRHHRFNEAFTALLRKAGYSASTEKNPFKVYHQDRAARLRAAYGAETGPAM